MNLRQKEIIGVPKVFEKGTDIMSAPAGKMKDEGYEVINIGNPTNEARISLFFNMEKSTMGF